MKLHEKHTCSNTFIGYIIQIYFILLCCVFIPNQFNYEKNIGQQLSYVTCDIDEYDNGDWMLDDFYIITTSEIWESFYSLIKRSWKIHVSATNIEVQTQKFHEMQFLLLEFISIDNKNRRCIGNIA